MKYKLSIKNQSGFEYSVEDGILIINEIKIEEPTNTDIVEYDIDEETEALGITRCYRTEDEVIVNLTLFVTDLEPYKSGNCVKAGIKYQANSKWDLSKPMTADEVINGNVINQEVLDV